MSRTRLAGKALKWLLSKPGATAADPWVAMNKWDIAKRLGPDAGFALLNAAQTPGDIGDKIISGGTDFALSGFSGLAAGRATGSGTVDQLASIAGAYSAMPVADTVMRGKDRMLGGMGLTPYDRLSLEQQELMKQQITQQVMSTYGMLPGNRTGYYPDPSSGMGVA